MIYKDETKTEYRIQIQKVHKIRELTGIFEKIGQHLMFQKDNGEDL